MKKKTLLAPKETISRSGEVKGYNRPDLPYAVIRTWGQRMHNVTTFHWHQDIQIDLVISGEIRYLIGKEQITVTEGNGILINSHTLHAQADTDADYISVRFHPLLVSANEYIEKTFISPVAGNPEIPYVYLDHEVYWKNDILEVIRSFYMFNAGGAEDMPLLAEVFFFTIWHSLYGNLPMLGESHPESTKMTALKTMVDYIQKNYSSPITLQDIADAGNMSVSGCSALFREMIQDSPYHYLLTSRLQQARILLCNEDTAVTEIAEQCGFPDTSHFIKAFRTAYGTTPLQYRKKVAGKKAKNSQQ